MAVGFFDEAYRTEQPRDDRVFGICDPKGELPAYTTVEQDGPDKWCAHVQNLSASRVLFVPIDKNIVFRDSNGNLESSCDGMLVVEDKGLLCFIELKDVREQWISKATSQLQATIERFNALHDYRLFRQRRAYACNPSRPWVYYSDRTGSQRFYQTTHFRLLIQNMIDIPE